MNREQFEELQQLVLEAKDRLTNTASASGSHYMLMHLLAKYKVYAITREEAIRLGQKLCDEWVRKQQEQDIADQE